jgi:hypothetical protein
MTAGCEIFSVTPDVVSMLPPVESCVRNAKPLTKPVDRGFLNPAILKETSVPPGMSLVARFETVSTEFWKEHCRLVWSAAVFNDEQEIAPYRYSS